MAEARQTMNSEISCVHQAEILGLMAARGFSPETVLKGILGNSDYPVESADGQVVPVDQQYLRNRKNWVSHDLSLHVFKNVARLIGGERPLFQVGRTIYSSKLSGPLGWLVRFLAVNPEWLLTRTFEISERFIKVKKINIVEFDRGSGMRVQVAYTSATLARSTLSCEYNEGILVGFSSIFARKVISKKTRCVCENDPHCEYILSWERRSLPEILFRSASPSFQLMQDDLEGASYIPDEDARTL